MPVDAEDEPRHDAVDDEQIVAHHAVDQGFLAPVVDRVYGRDRLIAGEFDIGVAAVVADPARPQAPFAAQPVAAFDDQFGLGARQSGAGRRIAKADRIGHVRRRAEQGDQLERIGAHVGNHRHIGGYARLHRLDEEARPVAVGGNLPGAAVADRDILDQLVRAQLERDLIAGRGLDLDDLVGIIFDALDARVARTGRGTDLRRCGRGGQGSQGDQQRPHSSTSGARGWAGGCGAGACWAGAAPAPRSRLDRHPLRRRRGRGSGSGGAPRRCAGRQHSKPSGLTSRSSIRIGSPE